jgi:hypothetical protein
MLWGEVTKWAKSHGYKISKKENIFVWSCLTNTEKNGEENSLEDVVKKVFNEITNYKFLDHQNNYQKKQV